MIYKVIKDFYSVKELDLIFNRAKMLSSKYGGILTNYGFVIPGLFRTDKKILKILKINLLIKNLEKELNKKLKLTLHSDYHLNTCASWHNDKGTKNNSYVLDSFKKEEIFKVAVFYNNSNVTKFKTSDNKICSPKINRGDLIIFPIEVMHRGASLNILSKLISICFRKFYFFCMLYILKRNRRAIFFTIGVENENLNFFINKNLEREDADNKKHKIFLNENY